MFKRWVKIALICLVVTAVLFGASFLFPASYYVCHPEDYNHTKDCATYHLGPAVLVFLGAQAEIHNGFITAIATALLAVITGVLVWISLRADITARLVAKNGIRQTVIARRQLALIGLQSDILEKQKEIQRQEFLITHRPRIRIRSVAGPLKIDGDKVEFLVYFTNAGSTTAEVMSTRLEVSYLKDGNLIPIIKGEFVPDAQSLKSGFGAYIRRTPPEGAQAVFPPPVLPLLVSGGIIYRDGAGIIRATSFGRCNKPPSISLEGSEGIETMNFED